MDIKTVSRAILVAGTLDIASAIVLTIAAGRPVERMLAGIAAGPFGDGVLDMGLTAAALGLATHYALMSVMVIVFAGLSARFTVLGQRRVLAGALYGLAIYLVMYWLVIPVRWPGAPDAVTLRSVAVPILIHVLLVGLPISLIVSRAKREAARAVEAAPRGSEAI